MKQLIVVAEGTAALGPYWHTIVSDYLHKIIRLLFFLTPPLFPFHVRVSEWPLYLFISIGRERQP